MARALTELADEPATTMYFAMGAFKNGWYESASGSDLRQWCKPLLAEIMVPHEYEPRLKVIDEIMIVNDRVMQNVNVEDIRRIVHDTHFGEFSRFMGPLSLESRVGTVILAVSRLLASDGAPIIDHDKRVWIAARLNDYLEMLDAISVVMSGKLPNIEANRYEKPCRKIVEDIAEHKMREYRAAGEASTIPAPPSTSGAKPN